MHDVWDSIRRSKYVIADVTAANPNVMYELGLAHAAGRTPLLISQNMKKIPFDIQNLQNHSI